MKSLLKLKNSDAATAFGVACAAWTVAKVAADVAEDVAKAACEAADAAAVVSAEATVAYTAAWSAYNAAYAKAVNADAANAPIAYAAANANAAREQK